MSLPGHSPFGARKLYVSSTHLPMTRPQPIPVRYSSCPQKGASANPVWIHAWHSDCVMGDQDMATFDDADWSEDSCMDECDPGALLAN